ncbi:MAG: hypothetical protein P9M06_07630 [Candidatus Saelkia tenebricola]|nr:hypothetical protein [Candidatus Saelkia tenebricola]
MLIPTQGSNFYQKESDFSVCFSGGIDSTFVACYLGLEYKRDVHLVTADHGYGNLFPGFRNRHIRDIEMLLGEKRVYHQFINIKDTFNQILVSSLEEDYKRYRSNFIWCLGCILSVHTHMIIYNLIHSIPKCFLCSSVGGHEFAVMSIPVTVNAMREFYASFGIMFSTPLLDLNILKPDEKEQLRQWGIWPGLVVGKGTLGVQPVCIPGFLQHWKDVFFGIHPIYDNEKVFDFIKMKIPIMNKIINDYFENSSIPLESAKEKLMACNKTYLEYNEKH